MNSLRGKLTIGLTVSVLVGTLTSVGSAATLGKTSRIDLIDAPDLEKAYVHLLPDIDISSDGRWLVYVKAGSVYLYDRILRRTELITKRPDGSPDTTAGHPRISDDGQAIAFVTQTQYVTEGGIGSNPDIYIYRRATGQFEWATYNRDGNQESTGVWAVHPALTPDGNYLAFVGEAEKMVPGDDNPCIDEHALPACSDVFLRDLKTKSIERISRGLPGLETAHNIQGLALFAVQPTLSDDARFVAFRATSGGGPSSSGVLPASWIFLRDRATNTTELISKTTAGLPAGFSLSPSISGDGRYVAFVSNDRNIVPNDSNNAYDVFVADRTSGTITRASTDSSGGEASSQSIWPSLSADGRYLAFTSWASDLVTGDDNGRADVFLKDLTTGAVERISVSSAGEQGNAHSTLSVLSREGRFAAFLSEADNLTADDPDIRPDLYLWERGSG